MRRPALLALSLVVLHVAACKGGAKGTGDGAGELPPPGAVLQPGEAQVDAGPARRAEKAAGTGERVTVPGGKTIAGSTPGDEGRDPMLEPSLLEVELGPFEIDKLPYPNDATKPPRTGVSRDEARALCQERGQRLCTELEWERACKGPSNDLYAAGNGWDAVCAKEPASCASGFGVLAMGGALREWTDSDGVAGDKDERRRAVMRGAAATADGVDHRCAHRALVDATTKGPDTGFRCCKGPPNAAAIPPPKTGEPSFNKAQIELSRVQAMLASIPKLAPYAKEVSFFNEEEAVKTVLSRGDAGAAKPGPVITTSPVLWTPVPTEEVLVMALKAKGASLVVAFYQLGEGRHRLASALVLKDEPGPVVLSHTSFNKRRVLWSTCWECQGEQGGVELKDGKRVVVVHY